MDRIRARPFATLVAIISAVLIVLGRINHDEAWGTPVLVVGIVLLVVAGALVYLKRG
jgi:hypothetical protein